MPWIQQHSETINALAGVGMLVVWISYLQLFINSYRRQRRAKILINRGAGSGLEARCLVSNMSAEAIYIQSIIVIAATPEETITAPVTELDGLEDWEDPPDLKRWTRQGPLGAAQVRDMGTFRVLLEHVLKSRDGDGWDRRLGQIAWLEIQIIAIYGSEDLVVGARRRFEMARAAGTIWARACTIDTQQIRSRRERRKIARALGDRL